MIKARRIFIEILLLIEFDRHEWNHHTGRRSAARNHTPLRPQFQHSTPQKPRNHRASPNPRKTPSPSSSSKKRNSPPMDESALDNPDLGPFLLKLARNTIASGESPVKALEYAIRASKSFERFEEMKLDLAMSLHVTAAIYCSLGNYEEAVPVLERAVAVPEMDIGAEHALAKFSGYMQLGDTYSMIGRVDQSIESYGKGLEIQIAALGEMDPRVAETCRRDLNLVKKMRFLIWF